MIIDINDLPDISKITQEQLEKQSNSYGISVQHNMIVLRVAVSSIHLTKKEAANLGITLKALSESL